jgi:heptosyltransferase-2
LLHVAAAIGTPAIGIFGPTSPDLWKPINPIAAVIQSRTDVPCRPCHKPVCRMQHHACMRDISTAEVIDVAQRVLAEAGVEGKLLARRSL